MSEGDVQPPTMKVAEAHNIGERVNSSASSTQLRRSEPRNRRGAKSALQVWHITSVRWTPNVNREQKAPRQATCWLAGGIPKYV